MALPLRSVSRAAGIESILLDRGRGEYTLELRGRLPPSWSGQLFLGLSRLGMSISRGFAKRSMDGWVAEIDFVIGSGSADPATVDYRAPATARSARGAAVPITLRSYSLRGPTSDGAVHLRVDGTDQLGFLGSLLQHLAFLSLFPVQVTIDTRGDRVSDAFLLKSTGGRAPSEKACAALRRLLDGLIEPR